MEMRAVWFASLGVLSLAAAAQPTVSTDGEQMRLDPGFQIISPRPGGGWDLLMGVGNDNNNPSLPSSWRRWWHFQVSGLNAASGETLNISIFNATYFDTILPVWSQSTDEGVTFGAYERMPESSLLSTFDFRVETPPGVTDVRIAKYFPYTTADKDALLGSIQPSPHVTASVIGSSEQGRPIHMVQITDPMVSDDGKHRIWIHSAVHPAETTGYFVVEGLITFLLSGEPEAVTLLRSCIFNIVPMANPDGVFLGNYRSNANSVNLESDWSFPYDSSNAEVAVLRTAIERFMGTSANPGSNPIEVVLNLHSSHGLSFPFHFEHRPNFNINGTGVIPEVNAFERQWIAAFRARSPFTDWGITQLSDLTGRPFVESMMHDRWSIDPLWTGPPNNLPLVMAITYEGTYGAGPDRIRWNTPEDYRLNGKELALALFDYFSLTVSDPPAAGLLLR